MKSGGSGRSQRTDLIGYLSFASFALFLVQVDLFYMLFIIYYSLKTCKSSSMGVFRKDNIK